MNKIVISSLVVVAVLAGFAGGYFFHRTLVSGSPAGSTLTNAKFAGIVVNPSVPGANATSTSILNTDTFDRYVTGFSVGCENVGTSKTAYTGTGLANWQISIGTTTTAAPATFLSFAAIASSFNLSTSTSDLIAASSTLQIATSSLAMVWPTNTYMTFSFNATNTAACTVGVSYTGS